MNVWKRVRQPFAEMEYKCPPHAFVGINIAVDLSKLPSPEQVLTILRAHQITHVRLFNSDALFLNALSDTGIEVMISVANSEIPVREGLDLPENNTFSGQ
ncbi:hypothetical protein L1887_15153 [Cichorium endivia]|nr:hypothetical protein L1887_15153 [Cichorium endivia]